MFGNIDLRNFNLKTVYKKFVTNIFKILHPVNCLILIKIIRYLKYYKLLINFELRDFSSGNVTAQIGSALRFYKIISKFV